MGLIILISSCCKEGVETDRFLLTDFEKNFIPYQLDDSVSFVHSNGHHFSMSVNKVEIKLEKTETEHCGEDYVSYETKHVGLYSGVPQFYIDFKVSPKNFEPMMSVTINRQNFLIDITALPELDSIVVDGQIYTSVYQSIANVPDTTVVTPKELLYNQTNGILQIKMTNHETYTVQN